MRDYQAALVLLTLMSLLKLLRQRVDLLQRCSDQRSRMVIASLFRCLSALLPFCLFVLAAQ